MPTHPVLCLGFGKSKDGTEGPAEKGTWCAMERPGWGHGRGSKEGAQAVCERTAEGRNWCPFKGHFSSCCVQVTEWIWKPEVTNTPPAILGQSRARAWEPPTGLMGIANKTPCGRQ